MLQSVASYYNRCSVQRKFVWLNYLYSKTVHPIIIIIIKSYTPHVGPNLYDFLLNTKGDVKQYTFVNTYKILLFSPHTYTEC